MENCIYFYLIIREYCIYAQKYRYRFIETKWNISLCIFSIIDIQRDILQSMAGTSNKKMRKVPCAYNFNRTKITNYYKYILEYQRSITRICNIKYYRKEVYNYLIF